MKRTISVIIVALLSVSAFTIRSQEKIDLRSRQFIRELVANDDNGEEKYVSAIIKISDDRVLSRLTEMGVKLINRRDELLLVYIPASEIDNVEDELMVSHISVGKQCFPLMDKARAMCNVDKVASGDFQYGPYNGSGVVVGFSDIGFEPNHITFYDENKKSRVKRLVNYVDSMGIIEDISEEKFIRQWTTDRSEEFHATHVGGILAGSYKGNGYEGVATAAEIVATTSELYDASILAGVENIVEYARQESKPAVVNLSVGSYTGPHDGTDLFCQYLDRVGEEAVICISAGNEGMKQNTLSKRFNDNDKSLNTFICNRAWDLIHIAGMSDFWSEDSLSFRAKMCIYDCVEKKIIYESPYVGGDSGVEEWGIASVETAGDEDETNELIDSCFSGYMRLYAGLNAENNRYNIMYSYDVTNHKYNQKWGRYCPGIMLEGSSGMRIDGYADGSYSCFRSMGYPGFENGNSNCSVSNIACGKNVIVVGSSNSRNKVPMINGGDVTFDFEEGQASDFSGYGTLIDGRKLPDICAPGNMVVSSINSYFVKNQSEDFISQLASKMVEDDKEYYWYATCGTSMSSPFAAGVCALWLQADATLTPAEIKEIATLTANRNVLNPYDPRWGAGNIDALAGINEVLLRSSVDNVMLQEPCVSVELLPSVCSVKSAGSKIERLSFYNACGVILLQKTVDANAVDLDVSNLPKGVYLMSIVTASQRSVNKIVVR